MWVRICRRKSSENFVASVGKKLHSFAIIDLTSRRDVGKYRVALITFLYLNNYRSNNKMEVDLLKQIVKNTEHKLSFQIIVSDSKSRFKTRFNPKLQLDRGKKYEIALVNLETCYSFPNIDESNNVLVYSPADGNSWEKIRIPEGSYEIDDINNTIHHEMEKREHHDPVNETYYINISTNSNTLTSVLILEEDYQVDYNHQSSIVKVF